MSHWQNKTVLVAGGAGFIGHDLVVALLDTGAIVHVVDDYRTGQKSHLDALCAQHPERLHTHTQDISHAAALPKADTIYNLASPASPVHYQADPVGTWKSNVLGTLHLLEHAQTCNATFIQASTSEVYGDPLQHPQVESDWGNVNPVGPRACYDESKRAAETLLMDAVRVHDTDVRIGRIFNTYGPGMRAGDGRAVPNFVAQAQTGRPITIHGDGTQTRSLCYVSDTVDALLLLGSSGAARGEIFNIGNPVEMTILQIAEHVNAAFQNQSQIVFEPRPIDDPARRCPDITKAQQVLGWSPKISFADGLRRLLDGDDHSAKSAINASFA
ncbi:MAG: GDP-mannose 4,6-dehydratase [Pseudomonadota bacterium]